MPETAVHSFIIRFIHEQGRQSTWRGIIRHIQSSEEIRFSSMEDCLRFMDEYVTVVSVKLQEHPQDTSRHHPPAQE